MVEYYSQYDTGQTDWRIEKLQQYLDKRFASQGSIPDDVLLKVAADLSYKNIDRDRSGRLDFDNIEGGPFGAVIYKREESGRVVIVGMGANHVVPESDPSAHAEMSAIRDATQRLGFSDLSGYMMATSCQCCPQCENAVTGSGISEIVFSNTQVDAGNIGFSDDEQHRHIPHYEEFMMQVDEPGFDGRSMILRERLGDNGAVILDENDEIIAVGNAYEESNDPTASLASMNAIRAACEKRGSHFLPTGCTIVTREKIHPASFTTADWARIGRIPHSDEELAADPANDDFMKDPTRMVYVEDRYEEMSVRGQDRQSKVVNNAEAMLNDLQSKPEERELIVTSRTDSWRIQNRSMEAFNRWQKLTGQVAAAKY